MTQAVEQPLHRALGLTDREHERICGLLGREPNDFELAVFSLLWSEHCGYKHSARLLRRLPSSGPHVLQGPGENAGVVDLGDGEAVAFKVESHNHPSAVEPFQGAATGVGGILRDIVAMGARPIALLDGLWFGDSGWMFRRAVAGIGHYGNCLAADEMVLVRNSGHVAQRAIGELVEERGPDPVSSNWSAPPRKAFEVLSIDPETHEPMWREVSRVFKRDVPRLVRITAALGRTLTVSEDHPAIVWEDGCLRERPARALRVGDRLPLLTALPQQDSHASIDLIESVDEPSVVQLNDDFFLTPEAQRVLFETMPRADARHYWLSRHELPVSVFKRLESHLSLGREHLRLRLGGPRSTSVPAVLDVNEDFARLIGYYLSEGCCSKNGSTFRIIWTFGQNDRDTRCVADVRRILESLEIRHSVELRDSTTAITVSSRLLGRVFAETLGCGSRAHEKCVPSILLGASPTIRKEVLRGVFRGDGSFDYPKNASPVRIRHSTTSRRLHEQLVLLLQSFGIVPSTHRRPAKATTIQGRPVCQRMAYQLEFAGYNAVAEAADWFEPGDAQELLMRVRRTRSSPYARPRSKKVSRWLTTVPVRKIEAVEGQASVYDLEVRGTHLFATTGGIVTHNCVGVPTVGGETVFDEAYRDNCLVNAMCIGILPTERLTRASGGAPGHLVVLYGATTGRDGIGGASVLASQELGEDDADKRPSVQIGDPFTGKKLIEASVELVERGLVESLQDCGAAGLASALAEMARDGTGIDVHLDRVPLREDDLEPWETMISESQERMIAIVRPQMHAAVREVCRRWELGCTAIGEVTESARLRAFYAGEAVGDIPARLLTEECPRYDVERVPYAVVRTAPPRRPLPERLSGRRWIFEQYDHLVGSRTVRRPGLDAAVLRLRPSMRGLAVSLDGPPAGERDPWRAGALAAIEAARNVACAGGRPLALTDCLNFGNPEKPEIGWELAEAIEGLAQAAEALGTPVVSGNVSLYNETDGHAIPPTPVVGCVGLVPDVRVVPDLWRAGDVVLLASAPQPLDLAAEAALVRFLWQAAPLLTLAHDVDDGDLEAALSEAALWSGVGAELELPDGAHEAGRAVIACAPEDVPRLGSRGLQRLGIVGGDRICEHDLDGLRHAWEAVP